MSPDEALPELRKPPPVGEVIFTAWTIYDHPSDFPRGYVLRCCWTMRGGEIIHDFCAWYASDPDELRAILPLGLVRIGRLPEDDPVILETWA